MNKNNRIQCKQQFYKNYDTDNIIYKHSFTKSIVYVRTESTQENILNSRAIFLKFQQASPSGGNVDALAP